MLFTQSSADSSYSVLAQYQLSTNLVLTQCSLHSLQQTVPCISGTLPRNKTTAFSTPSKYEARRAIGKSAAVLRSCGDSTSRDTKSSTSTSIDRNTGLKSPYPSSAAAEVDGKRITGFHYCSCCGEHTRALRQVVLS